MLWTNMQYHSYFLHLFYNLHVHTLSFFHTELSFDITDTYTFGSWRLFLVLCTTPILLALLGLMVMPESPRFLLQVRQANGKNNDNDNNLLIQTYDIYNRFFTINSAHSQRNYINTYYVAGMSTMILLLCYKENGLL